MPPKRKERFGEARRDMSAIPNIDCMTGGSIKDLMGRRGAVGPPRDHRVQIIGLQPAEGPRRQWVLNLSDGYHSTAAECAPALTELLRKMFARGDLKLHTVVELGQSRTVQRPDGHPALEVASLRFFAHRDAPLGSPKPYLSSGTYRQQRAAPPARR